MMTNDKNDARKLGTLARARALHPVYVPPEPFRNLRMFLCYEQRLTRQITREKLRLKALIRKCGIPCKGTKVYNSGGRVSFFEKLPDEAKKAYFASLCRNLDFIRKERLDMRKRIREIVKKFKIFNQLQTIPGFGYMTAQTFIGWIVEPNRFKTRAQVISYAGLGLKNNESNGIKIIHPRASVRGQRALKRVLFLAAWSVVGKGKTKLSKRYERRIESGWKKGKAIRDLARQLLLIGMHVRRTGEEYYDAKVSLPGT
jgi:transposase